MKISVEISYYPLNNYYKEHVYDFLKRLHDHAEIEIRTNGMSTQVFGEFFQVMSAIKKEMRKSMELPQSVFVLKVANADLRP